MIILAVVLELPQLVVVVVNGSGQDEGGSGGVDDRFVGAPHIGLLLLVE